MFFQRPPEWPLWEVFFLPPCELVDKEARLGFRRPLGNKERLMPMLHQLLDEENSELPRKRQCELLSLHRSGTYYKPRAKADETPIEKALNELYIKGLRKLPDMVERHYGIKIGAKKNCTHTQRYEDKNHLPV